MSAPERRRRHQLAVYGAMASAKLARGCAQCGYRDHPDALEFDHISGGGGHAWSRRRSFVWLAELLADPNVQVLCGNCHNIKSRGEQRKQGKDGLDER